ncbi:hypothetical protein GCM10010246_21070 [Streptomyces cuspidosporus]|uniref:Uncharacterized protein n=1 Tax=Streptomyces cuspidosporus TaxID=66882 RepID=A0ABN3FS83_9ACTN
MNPGLPLSTGLGPVCSPPLFFCPDVGGVEDDAGDVDQAGDTQTVQHGFVQAPHTRALDQIRKRRWAADFDTPKHGGNARQAHPLTST